MADDFRTFIDKHIVSESKKKDEEDGLSILDIRRFIKLMLPFAKDKEILKTLIGIHNVLARMESKRGTRQNLLAHRKKTKR